MPVRHGKAGAANLLSNARFDPVMPRGKGKSKPRRGITGFNCVPSVDLSRVS